MVKSLLTPRLYSGEYPRLSRGRPGFYSPTRSSFLVIFADIILERKIESTLLTYLVCKLNEAISFQLCNKNYAMIGQNVMNRSSVIVLTAKGTKFNLAKFKNFA